MQQSAVVGNVILAAAAWVATYTGIPGEPAAILAVLMVVDFFSGITKASSIGKPITSHRIKTGVVSKCSVLLIPLVVALAAKGLGADFHWFVSWVVSLLILSEAYSIIANIYTARTKVELPEWEVISIILRKIRSVADELDKR